MEPFIRNDQYNFIKAQIQTVINGHATVNGEDVLSAIKSIAEERVFTLFTDMSEEQKQLLHPISQIEDKADGEAFLAQLKPYVIPFKEVTEKTIKKLFPKVKKLKLPALENLDRRDFSYLGWNDYGANKKYIVTEHNQKLIGLQGTFKRVHDKGVCALCHGIEEVGMFMCEKKGSSQDAFIKRGNYICQDSQKCNENLTTLDRLTDFVERLS
ncbi:elongation factor G-binding protein [Priestia megaterium]|nr:elongation factor G-binding protein [Priestia megaterium]